MKVEPVSGMGQGSGYKRFLLVNLRFLTDPIRKATLNDRSPTPWPPGDSQVAALMRAHDWTCTPLGAIEHWPRSLRTSIEIVLGADVPIAIQWGPRYLMFYNDAYIACLGPRHPAALGRPLAEVFSEAWVEVEPEVSEVMQTGRARSIKDRQYMLDSGGQLQPRWFSGHFSPIRDDTGHVAGIFNPAFEVTDRVLAERKNAQLLAQAQGSARQLEQMFDQAPGFMAVVRGPEHRFVLANRAYYQLVGHRELLGRTVREALPEIETQGFFELLDRVYASGEPFIGRHMQLDVQRQANGAAETRYIDFVYQPLVDADGSVVGIFAEGQDVTEQHHAMAALADSEQRFRLIAENASVGQFSWDLTAELVTLPAMTRDLFELGSASVHIDRIFERIHPQDLAAAKAGVEPAFDPAGNGAMRASYRVVRSDGSIRWVDSFGQAQFATDPDGTRRAVHAVGVIWDVTEHQLMVEQLQEADQRKDEFLAMLAHELRNPLAPLVNAHRLLGRTEPLTARGRAALALAERQARQLHRLVDDLLEVSRVSRGHIALKREPMLVASAVHDAVESVTATVEARGQQLQVAIPEQPVPIFADPVRVAQVLENLLANACKYTPAGGSIRVDVEEQAGVVAIRVVDDGVGIEPAKLAGLFNLFHQIDATIDRSQGGLGIGLALVKRLVELHGGTVSAESMGLGCGATFTVRLPRAEQP